MITTHNNQRYYDGFKVVSSLKQNKKDFKYTLNERHLEKILAVLNEGKHEFLQPRVAHFTVFINDAFDFKTLSARLKRVFGSENMLFAYSVEKKVKLHIHLMLVLETKNLNPVTAFYYLANRTILALKNVEGCDLNPRLNWEKNKPAKYFHDLKNADEFRDAVERFSYFTKENDKNKVVAIYKKFATSNLKHEKYYAILGNKNMIKIKQIHKNEKLQFCDDNTVLDKRYLNFRITKNVEDETKLMFHFVDTSENNKTIGFYGYSYFADISSEHYILTISIDDLYIDPSYSKLGIFSDYFSVLFFHLRDEIRNVLGQVKSELKDQQKLMTNSLAYYKPLEEVLRLVVSNAVEEHGISLLT